MNRQKNEKIIYILFLVSIIGCIQNENKIQLDLKSKEEVLRDSKILNSLADSLNSIGNYEYYEKYMLKIDEMIKKFPEPYRRNFSEVKKSLKEIYEGR